MSLLDNPLITSILFYPRLDTPGGSHLPNVIDSTIPVEDGIVLGYRLYLHEPGKPVVLFFHGNGEIASDYDNISAYFQNAGASLLVVDYRGYGWSTGKPKASFLQTDTEAVFAALPDILKAANLAESPLYVMGRSLGSAPAIYLAHLHPQSFKGIIIESGFAHVLPLLARLGLPAQILGSIPDPVGNVSKMQELDLPLLVIHGVRDNLIPIANGETLYQASPAAQKRLVKIAAAGHNDLLYYGIREYFDAIAEFINATSQTNS
ncbi:MAG TPA: alpha/beta fold hydrolase [Aggregatilineales bacterium]|nr:alpha/beta fold hydrolase [Aggregatilineales bacterium]